MFAAMRGVSSALQEMVTRAHDGGQQGDGAHGGGAAPSAEPPADVTDGGSGARGLDGAQRSALRQPGSTNRRQRVAKRVRFADGV